MFWDLFGEQGHPIRTTISEMGPLLLARLMGLNEVQEGVLAIAFRVADEQNLLLLDMPDLQAMLVWCAENADTLTTRYGNVSKATVRSEEHTSELQSLMRTSYAVFFLKKKKQTNKTKESIFEKQAEALHTKHTKKKCAHTPRNNIL